MTDGGRHGHFCCHLYRRCRVGLRRAGIHIPPGVSLARSRVAHCRRARPVRPRQHHRKTAPADLFKVYMRCDQTGLPFCLVFDRRPDRVVFLYARRTEILHSTDKNDLDVVTRLPLSGVHCPHCGRGIT